MNAMCGRIAFVAALGLGVAAVQADTMYGTFVGTNVTYVGVSEVPGSSNPNPNAPLYGTPTVVGNSLTFRPANFQSAANWSNPGTSDSQIIDSDLLYTLVASPHQYIKTLTIQERGDYSLVKNAEATIAATFFWQIDSGEGDQSYIGSSDFGSLIYPGGSDFVHSGTGTGTGTWQGSVTIDFEQLCPGIKITTLEMNMDNTLVTTLTGTGPDGSSALIRKKTLGDAPALGIYVNESAPVPAPAAIWVGMSLLAALGAGRGIRSRMGR